MDIKTAINSTNRSIILHFKRKPSELNLLSRNTYKCIVISVPRGYNRGFYGYRRAFFSPFFHIRNNLSNPFQVSKQSSSRVIVCHIYQFSGFPKRINLSNDRSLECQHEIKYC